MPQHFYDLKIWKEGYELLMKVYNLTNKYPPEEKYSLTKDTRRSGNSIIANIAEAHGRYYYADKARVLYISRGEIEETQSHLRVALGRGYITQEEFRDMDNGYEKLAASLNQYINYLFEQKNNPKTNN